MIKLFLIIMAVFVIIILESNGILDFIFYLNDKLVQILFIHKGLSYSVRMQVDISKNLYWVTTNMIFGTVQLKL